MSRKGRENEADAVKVAGAESGTGEYEQKLKACPKVGSSHRNIRCIGLGKRDGLALIRICAFSLILVTNAKIFARQTCPPL